MTAIVQARRGSTRLPDKILMRVADGPTLLEIVLSKCLRAFGEGAVVVATTHHPSDDAVELLARKLNCGVHRGSDNDVLARFVAASEEFPDDHFVRVCSDNPFLLSTDMTRLAEMHVGSNCDYTAFAVHGVPSIRTHLGLWAEALSRKALLRTNMLASLQSDREHVTKYIYEHPQDFKLNFIERSDVPKHIRQCRMTVDTKADLDLLASVAADLGTFDPSIAQLEVYLGEKPDLLRSMQEQIRHNEK